MLNESYVDFNTMNIKGFSALYMAFRTGDSDTSISAIDLLARNGLQLTKVFSDGRTVLHFAAEYGVDDRPLKHMYYTYGITGINHRDQWGWTPLHYGIQSITSEFEDARYTKVRFLLEKGADPYTMGKELLTKPFHPSNCLPEPVSPFGLSACLQVRRRRCFLIHERFAADAEAAAKGNLEVGDEEIDDEFFEVQEDLD